ncbi:15-hydroxyprostaglandin dehydrogenase [Eumeta japonica]|uniref:15-hydroxyprostaglandin dehydrogenase n=1 Tax=Eumeta variegata TaxID=151549 RepID=A0A4C1UZ51_EUMVA|nr:15-hydroxyprostaglandin dehydrogenase [Eumeta japonica]
MAVYDAKDKVVFVTGGATGIGALTVKAFLEEGAKHVAILDVAKDAGVALEAELKDKYGDNKAKFIKCDVSNEEELLNAYNVVIESNGHVDVVINNAGILNDSKDIYKKALEVNVTALITSTLKALELMRKDKGGNGGAIINISSIAGLMQTSLLPIYSAAKSAVLQFSNCIGMEPHYSRTGVRVIAICFGATDTALLSRQKFGGFDEASDAELEEHFKMFPFQRPESAAAGVMEAFKKGSSASSWLITHEQPAVDITNNVTEAYSVLSRGREVKNELCRGTPDRNEVPYYENINFKFYSSIDTTLIYARPDYKRGRDRVFGRAVCWRSIYASAVLSMWRSSTCRRKLPEAELKKKFGADKVKFIECDVTDEEQLFNAYGTVVDDNGHVDVVVNNAGILNESRNVYKKALAVNVINWHVLPNVGKANFWSNHVN